MAPPNTIWDLEHSKAPSEELQISQFILCSDSDDFALVLYVYGWHSSLVNLHSYSAYSVSCLLILPLFPYSLFMCFFVAQLF